MDATEHTYRGKMPFIRMQIELGESLRQGFETRTCVALAREYEIASRYTPFKDNESFAIRAVEFAIRGNANSDYGPVYDPLVDEAHRKELVSQRSGARARTQVANLLAGRGVIPWGESEISSVQCLSEQETYTGIARQINAQFHGGKSVRNRNSVKRLIEKLDMPISRSE